MFESRVLLFLLATACCQVSADTVYDSVDNEGRVTYSDKVPAGAVQARPVEITTEQPSPSSVEASRQRARQMIEAADESQRKRDTERLQREQRTKSAEKELKQAQARLNNAKDFREGDRQGAAGGGNRITPQYKQRVEAAEADKEAAQQRLNEAGSGR